MNPAQFYRALLHQDTMTYWEIKTYPPANQVEVYRALLHQYSMSYWEINTYLGQTDPTQIKHRFTELSTPGYYDLLKNWDLPPC